MHVEKWLAYSPKFLLLILFEKPNQRIYYYPSYWIVLSEFVKSHKQTSKKFYLCGSELLLKCNLFCFLIIHQIKEKACTLRFKLDCNWQMFLQSMEELRTKKWKFLQIWRGKCVPENSVLPHTTIYIRKIRKLKYMPIKTKL